MGGRTKMTMSDIGDVKIEKARRLDASAILDLQKLCFSETAKRYEDDRILPLTQTQDDLLASFSQRLYPNRAKNLVVKGEDE